MNIRKTWALGAVGGAALLLAAGSAQAAHTTYQEREQTRQLNLQEAQLAGVATNQSVGSSADTTGLNQALTSPAGSLSDEQPDLPVNAQTPGQHLVPVRPAER